MLVKPGAPFVSPALVSMVVYLCAPAPSLALSQRVVCPTHFSGQKGEFSGNQDLPAYVPGFIKLLANKVN